MLLVDLLAALNFASVFLIKRRLKNFKKTLKNVKGVTKMKKNVKNVFASMPDATLTQHTN